MNPMNDKIIIDVKIAEIDRMREKKCVSAIIKDNRNRQTQRESQKKKKNVNKPQDVLE